MTTVFMKKKILICCNFYPPFFIGGAEIIAHQQARQLQKAGYDVAVFCAKHDDGDRRYSILKEVFDELRVFRVIQHAQDYEVGGNFYKPALDKLFIQVVKEVKPDVVHFHNITGLSLGIIEKAHRLQIKTVLTLHDHWGFCFKNTLLKVYDQVCNDFSKCRECLADVVDNQGRLLNIRLRKDYIALQFNKVDYFVSPSRYLASAYTKVGLPAEKIHVISNGINVKRFSQIKKVSHKNAIRFTFIGNIGFHKGIHVLIAALKLLLERAYLGNLCIINIVGTGDMTGDLTKFVMENHLDSTVKIWGKVEHPQIESVYENTDVLITPSIWPENEPVTILEAMAAGIPIIASALGGNLDLIKDGVNGFLFDVGNAQMLADKMVEMTVDRNRIKSMGQQAYKIVADNTLSNYVSHIANIYQKESNSNNLSERIVLCSGEHLSPQCIRAINSFDDDTNKNQGYRFIMSDWLAPEDWEAVDILWIVDEKGREQDILNAMRQGRPILVPEQNQKLVELCRNGQCGLFYADEVEAEVCLKYLINKPSLLATLGQNAKKFSSKYKNKFSTTIWSKLKSVHKRLHLVSY
ncbi:glycosyltransferase family 4 protein [Rivularia sp. UHCC 0363]|uniref:glycosyltransferase family 4 protein n=1 Tax=Rivularia sp. UHCC 0363 TaxID=3110244 RepID=UPI002B1F6F44|nr:glycosyltransferase family 4 protein [Rivularia sp. UHCC 0363]MEA5597535.1 glycosyltransferase family 4 protein [Rivularia sp. UHCC 0363]